MPVTISDDSANVVGLFADMLEVSPEDAVLLYERLCGRSCRPTDGDATDATLQAIYNARGPSFVDAEPLADQRRSDFMERVKAVIRDTNGAPSLLARIVARITATVRR